MSLQMHSEFDIVIVGAGPAGSALAALLARDPAFKALRIALLDARRLDLAYAGDGKIKSCGGLLSPDAQKALACLNLPLPGGVLSGPQLFSVRTLDLTAGLERTYQRCYLNMDREKFDRWLFAASENSNLERRVGVTVKTVLPGPEADPAGHVVRCSDGAILRTRFVVGADGAASVVRRKLFPDLRLARYVSIQERFALNLPPHFAAFFDPSITDYYGWGLPKDDEFLLGAALPCGRDAGQRFETLKRKLRAFGYNPGAPLRREVTLILRPLLPPPPAAAPDGGACLLGEAAGYISSSSAEGFSYALGMAGLLHQSLAAAIAEQGPQAPGVYARACRLFNAGLRPTRLRLLAKACKKQFMYVPWLRRLILRSGLGALPVPEKMYN